MMLRSIHLKQFRSYKDELFNFGDGVTMIVGPNGTGKTNLLEAMYVSMRGTSFRVPDRQLPHYGSDWFRIDSFFEEQQRSVRFQTQASPAKQLVINGGAHKRFTRDARLPVVLFEPDMLRTLNGSPARRRKLLDDLVSQWFMDGSTLLRRFERVLLQRNNILKEAYAMPKDTLDDQLFAWDVSFAETASAIERCRIRVIAMLNISLSEGYSRIANKKQDVVIRYHYNQSPSQQHILQELRRHRHLDVARGYTTIGPHRSDFMTFLNGQPLELSASRGEQRSLMLAVKQIEARELERISDVKPLFLLDDITGELDPERIKNLLRIVAPYQTVATAPHHSALLDIAADKHIELPLIN